jgi:hypothetical protein
MNRVLAFSVIARSLIITLLFVATSQQSMPFYKFLRPIVFIASIYFAYESFRTGQRKWTIAYGVIALVFNPIMKVYLNKEVWQIIDVVTALAIFISLFASKQQRSNGT